MTLFLNPKSKLAVIQSLGVINLAKRNVFPANKFGTLAEHFSSAPLHSNGQMLFN